MGTLTCFWSTCAMNGRPGWLTDTVGTVLPCCTQTHQIDQIVGVVEETLKGHTVRLLKEKKEAGRKVGGAALSLPKIRRNALIEIISISTGYVSSAPACIFGRFALPCIVCPLLRKDAHRSAADPLPFHTACASLVQVSEPVHVLQDEARARRAGQLPRGRDLRPRRASLAR